MAVSKQQKKSREFHALIRKIRTERNCDRAEAIAIYQQQKNGSPDWTNGVREAQDNDPSTWPVDYLIRTAKLASDKLASQIAEHQAKIVALNDAKAHWDRVLAEGAHQTKMERARQAKPVLAVH